MKVFIGSTDTLLTYDTSVNTKEMMDGIGSATILLADQEFAAYNTYKDSHFDIVTVVDNDDNPDYFYVYDNTSGFEDQTTAACDETTEVDLTGHTGAPEVGDIIYIGVDEQFDYVWFNVDTINSDNVYAWEYWGGSWKDLEEKDDTKSGNYSFANDGLVVFQRHTDWATTAVNGQSAYWIRARVTTAGASNPDALRVRAGTIHFEGRVTDVEFRRNTTILTCSQLAIEVDDIILEDDATHTADFKLDSGTVTSCTSDTMTDEDKKWTADDWIGKGLLVSPSNVIVNPSTSYPGTPMPLEMNMGSPQLLQYELIGHASRYTVVRSTSINTINCGYKFEGDENDLDSFTFHYKFKVTETTAVAGQLEIYNYTDEDWDQIAAIDADDWVEGTQTSGDLPDGTKEYIDSDGSMLVRLNVTSTTGEWGASWDYGYFEMDYTNHYASDSDNTEFWGITDNDAETLTLDGDPTAKNVQTGDKYRIGERIDTAVETIFSDYTLNMTIDAETSSNYTTRDFSGSTALSMIRNCAELDAAHWWGARGRVLEFRTTFVSSGLTIDEDLIDPQSIRILRPAANYLKGVKVYGSPEQGVEGSHEDSGSSSSIWLRLYRRLIDSVTEAVQLAKNVAEALNTMKTNISFDILVESSTTRAIELGKTVDFEFDSDGDTIDEVTESNIIVRAISKEQEPAGPMKITVEIGFYPVDTSERFLGNLNMDDVRTNMHSDGRDDQYLERYLDKGGGIPTSLSALSDRDINALQSHDKWTKGVEIHDAHLRVNPDWSGSPSTYLELSADNTISSIGDEMAFRYGVTDKLWISTTEVYTEDNTVDIHGKGDVSADEDVDAVDDVLTTSGKFTGKAAAAFLMMPTTGWTHKIGDGANLRDADFSRDATIEDDCTAKGDFDTQGGINKTNNAHFYITVPSGYEIFLGTPANARDVSVTGNLDVDGGDIGSSANILIQSTSDSVTLEAGATIYLREYNGSNCDVYVETAASGAFYTEGGVYPITHEKGNVGAVNASPVINQAWSRMYAEEMYDTDGSLGSYSLRDDFTDLRAIQELKHPETEEYVHNSWGDRIWDAGTIPKYLYGKHTYGFKPDRGYIASKRFKGWVISLIKGLDKRDLDKEEILREILDRLEKLEEKL